MEAAEHWRPEIACLVLAARDSASFGEAAEEKLFLSPPRWLGAKGKKLPIRFPASPLSSSASFARQISDAASDRLCFVSPTY